MMRVLSVMTLLTVWLMPSPAFAWFGWLDKMSGPGPYVGVLFEARVKCFGPTVPTTVDLDNTIRSLQEAVTAARSGARTAQDVDRVSTSFAQLLSQTVQLATALGMPVGYLSPDAVRQSTNRDIQAIDAYLAAVEKEAQTLADQSAFMRDAVAVKQLSGVLVELCQPNVVRRSSLDVGVDLWWSTNVTPEFANNERVRLVTYRASYSYTPNTNPFRDIFDLSAGLGAYQVTSSGLDESVTGLFIEPVRVYIHGPSSWNAPDAAGWKRVLGKLVLSGAFVWYPSGFDSGVFGSNEELEPEFRPTVGVYLNLNAFRRTIFRRFQP